MIGEPSVYPGNQDAGIGIPRATAYAASPSRPRE